MVGQPLDLLGQFGGHGLGAGVVAEVAQQHVAGLALDQRADIGAVLLADQQVALPVAGHGPVVTSAGRSEIDTMSLIWPRPVGPLRGLRFERPLRR